MLCCLDLGSCQRSLIYLHQFSCSVVSSSSATQPSLSPKISLRLGNLIQPVIRKFKPVFFSCISSYVCMSAVIILASFPVYQASYLQPSFKPLAYFKPAQISPLLSIACCKYTSAASYTGSPLQAWCLSRLCDSRQASWLHWLRYQLWCRDSV